MISKALRFFLSFIHVINLYMQFIYETSTSRLPHMILPKTFFLLILIGQAGWWHKIYCDLHFFNLTEVHLFRNRGVIYVSSLVNNIEMKSIVYSGSNAWLTSCKATSQCQFLPTPLHSCIIHVKASLYATIPLPRLPYKNFKHKIKCTFDLSS